MLLALALFAQSTALPASTAEAARICSAIELRSMETPNVTDLGRAFHFNLLAARETRGNGRMLDNLLAEQALVTPHVVGKTDDLALRADCRTRFPQAWATSATLPQDAFDRALLCSSATMIIASLAGTVEDAAEKRRWEAVSDRLAALPLLENDEARRRGITSADMMNDKADALLRQTLDTSWMLPVAEACEAAYPG